MLEKDSILNLCVLIALSDFELSKTETAKIIQLSKKLSIQFNVHNAVEEINKKFRDDFDTACDFYCGNINDIKNKRIAKEFIKEVAISDKVLKDREVRFLDRCKHVWGIEVFD